MTGQLHWHRSKSKAANLFLRRGCHTLAAVFMRVDGKGFGYWVEGCPYTDASFPDENSALQAAYNELGI